MDVIHDCVAGLDVHKDTVVACVRTMSGTKATRECRTYETTTEALLALLEQLRSSGCSVVAMEATGIYWLPVWKILSDGDFKLILANAAHIKAVPGRKTDMNDATWIADLAAHGLIKASFVPDEELHQLRTLMRTRKQLTREQTRHVQRIQKTLTEANIRLDSVISDIMGASGRRMIEAMIEGERDPRKLAALAHRSVKATPKQLYDALHGRLTDHHRFLLKLHLGQWDALDASIRVIDREPTLGGAPGCGGTGRQGPIFRPDRSRQLDPRGQETVGRSVLSEIGADMTRFGSDGHLIAWTGLCAGQNESAGKRKRTRLRKGNPWLKTALVQCAWAAKNAKNSYYRAQFLRLKARRGPQKAICAVAASILRAIYHMLTNGTVHEDLGADYFDRRSRLESQAARPPNRKARLSGEPPASRKSRIETEMKS